MVTFMLIINIVIILVAVVLIISVLMQQGNRAGLGAIGGGAETFFGKSKAKSYEGKLELITKISAAVFTVLVIVLAATYNRYGTATPSVTEPTVAPIEEATAAPETGAAAETAGAVAPTAETAATEAPTAGAAETAAAEAPTAAATAAPTAGAAATAEPTSAPLATEAPAASPAA